MEMVFAWQELLIKKNNLHRLGRKNAVSGYVEVGDSPESPRLTLLSMHNDFLNRLLDSSVF